MTHMETLRTLKEIDQDYVNICAQIGALEFQTARKLGLLKGKLFELVEEADSLKQESEDGSNSGEK